MGKRLYSLTDEHRAQLPAYTQRWIDNALSTKGMDDDDRRETIAAINGMYDAAHLSRPKHIVFVPSPFVLRFAGGIAAAIWWLSKNKTAATRAATDAAIRVATRAATRAATDAATDAATYAATYAAVHPTIHNATWYNRAGRSVQI